MPLFCSQQQFNREIEMLLNTTRRLRGWSVPCVSIQLTLSQSLRTPKHESHSQRFCNLPIPSYYCTYALAGPPESRGGIRRGCRRVSTCTCKAACDMGKWDCSQQVVFRLCSVTVPVKRHRGSQDTHRTYTGHTGARTGTQITQTNLTTIQNNPPKIQPARQRDDRNRGRGLNMCRSSPGADRSPRPTQKRPPREPGHTRYRYMPGVSTASWEVTGVLYRGGVIIR